MPCVTTLVLSERTVIENVLHGTNWDHFCSSICKQLVQSFSTEFMLTLVWTGYLICVLDILDLGRGYLDEISWLVLLAQIDYKKMFNALGEKFSFWYKASNFVHFLGVSFKYTHSKNVILQLKEKNRMENSCSERFWYQNILSTSLWFLILLLF